MCLLALSVGKSPRATWPESVTTTTVGMVPASTDGRLVTLCGHDVLGQLNSCLPVCQADIAVIHLICNVVVYNHVE